LLQWQQNIARNWNSVHFGEMGFETHDAKHFFWVQVFLGTLNAADLRVELYSNPAPGVPSTFESLTPCKDCPAVTGFRTYFAQVSAARSASDYTPRILPHHPSASVPLEASQILWQH